MYGISYGIARYALLTGGDELRKDATILGNAVITTAEYVSDDLLTKIGNKNSIKAKKYHYGWKKIKVYFLKCKD